MYNVSEYILFPARKYQIPSFESAYRKGPLVRVLAWVVVVVRLQHDDEDEGGQPDRHLEQVGAKVVHGVVHEGGGRRSWGNKK